MVRILNQLPDNHVFKINFHEFCKFKITLFLSDVWNENVIYCNFSSTKLPPSGKRSVSVADHSLLKHQPAVLNCSTLLLIGENDYFSSFLLQSAVVRNLLKMNRPNIMFIWKSCINVSVMPIIDVYSIVMGAYTECSDLAKGLASLAQEQLAANNRLFLRAQTQGWFEVETLLVIPWFMSVNISDTSRTQ